MIWIITRLVTNQSLFQNAPSQPDFWTRLENNMLATVVSVIEISLLIFAATRALFSIVSPKVSGGLYYLMVILPLALLMPALRAEATKTDIHDD